MAELSANQRHISFRSLQRSDYPLLQKWLAAPHVAAWWNECFDLPSLETKYGPRIDGRQPVYVYVIEHKGAPIGWMQWYRWSDFPEHASRLSAEFSSAGIDLAIGEIEMTGHGLGPAAIREFVARFVFVDLEVTSVVADPDERNLPSVSAFRKAGFKSAGLIRLVGESNQRQVVRLDR